MTKEVIITLDGLTKKINVIDLANIRLELGIYFSELVETWENSNKKTLLHPTKDCERFA